MLADPRRRHRRDRGRTSPGGYGIHWPLLDEDFPSAGSLADSLNPNAGIRLENVKMEAHSSQQAFERLLADAGSNRIACRSPKGSR